MVKLVKSEQPAPSIEMKQKTCYNAMAFFDTANKAHCNLTRKLQEPNGFYRSRKRNGWKYAEKAVRCAPKFSPFYSEVSNFYSLMDSIGNGNDGYLPSTSCKCVIRDISNLIFRPKIYKNLLTCNITKEYILTIRGLTGFFISKFSSLLSKLQCIWIINGILHTYVFTKM